MAVSRPNYREYHTYLSTTVCQQTPQQWNFKQAPVFNQFMEHVSKDHGMQYVECIERQFPQVSFDHLRAFVQLNDKYGSPTKVIFSFNCAVSQTTKLLYCSPSSMRYAYQALMTLNYMSQTSCTQVVEWGAGYGGMFVAMQVFAPLFGDQICRHVTLVETRESAPLLRAYLSTCERIDILYDVQICDDVDASEMKARVDADGPVLWVSHFCFTEMSDLDQQHVREQVLPHCAHGWLTWQTCFGDDVKHAARSLGVTIERIVYEEPATAPEHVKNYYIYF